MNYIVIVHYIIRCTVWKTHQREFGNIESAREWARQMYGGVRKGEEVTVLIYELKESMN